MFIMNGSVMHAMHDTWGWEADVQANGGAGLMTHGMAPGVMGGQLPPAMMPLNAGVPNMANGLPTYSHPHAHASHGMGMPGLTLPQP